MKHVGRLYTKHAVSLIARTKRVKEETHLRVPHVHARRLVPGRADRPQTLGLHHVAALVPEVPRQLLSLAESELLRLERGVAKEVQRIRRHRGVVGKPARVVRVHDLEPFPHVDHHRRRRRVASRVVAAFAQHDQRRASRAGPPCT